MSWTDTKPCYEWLDDLCCAEMWNLKCSCSLSGVSVCEEGDHIERTGMHRMWLTLKHLWVSRQLHQPLRFIRCWLKEKHNNSEMHGSQIKMEALSPPSFFLPRNWYWIKMPKAYLNVRTVSTHNSGWRYISRRATLGWFASHCEAVRMKVNTSKYETNCSLQQNTRPLPSELRWITFLSERNQVFQDLFHKRGKDGTQNWLWSSQFTGWPLQLSPIVIWVMTKRESQTLFPYWEEPESDLDHVHALLWRYSRPEQLRPRTC